MPHTTYALFRAIRSHQIASPNLTGSVRHGVPNACNLCHLDKTLEWTQRHLTRDYGQQPLPLTDEQKSTSAALLWLLKGHAAQRVITAWHVGWQPAQEASGADWLAPFQARLLVDPYGVVRYVGAQGLKKLPGYAQFEYDFLAPQEQLDRDLQTAVAKWQSLPGPRSRAGEEVLLDAQGKILEQKLSALLNQRDNRPVIIKE